MKIKKLKYLLLIFCYFVFFVGGLVLSAGGDCSGFEPCEDWQEQQPYPDCSCYPDVPPGGGGNAPGIQSYSVDMNQLYRTNNVLHVKYSISISDDDYDDYDIDCSKVTASNTSGNLNVDRCDHQQLSNKVKGEIWVNAPATSAVTISLDEGFFEAIDEDENIIGKSSSKSKTFQPVGVFGTITLVQQRWENDTLWVEITNNVENADNYTYDYYVSKIKINNNLHARGNGQIQTFSDRVVNTVEIAGASTGMEVSVTVEPGFLKAYDSSNNVVGYSNPGNDVFIWEETDPEPEPDPEPDPEPEIECTTPADENLSCASWGGNYYYDQDIECCVEGEGCYNQPDESGNCDAGFWPDENNCCAVDSCSARPGESGCQPGFALSGECCEPAASVCQGEDQYLPDGGTSASDCTGCAEGTIPNELHTRCICNPEEKCCGIQLNTVVPFIGDCIEMNSDSGGGDTTSVTSVTAFPILMQGLMKILMSAVMIFSFLMVIIAGLLMTTAGFGGSGGFTKGKTILKNVIISLILLGCSGLILSLINPNFFGG